MADTADLVVLGAFYGQGSKGQDGYCPWDSIGMLLWKLVWREMWLYPALICQHLDLQSCGTHNLSLP